MLIWFYHQMQKSQYLRGVNQQYGTLKDTPLLGAPAIVWVPNSDTYDDPDGNRNLALETITYGNDFRQVQFDRRGAGAELQLYVTGDVEEAYQNLEDLINRTANAIREAGFYNNQNGRITQGRYLDRAQLSENTVGYALQLLIYVPLYYLTPIYQPTSFVNVVPTAKSEPNHT